MSEFSGYRSRYKGPQIDALLGLVEGTLQSGGALLAPRRARVLVTADGQVRFDLASVPVNGVVLVSLNGVIQHEYALDGAAVVLTEPCLAGDDVALYWLEAA